MSCQDQTSADNARMLTGHPDFVQACLDTFRQALEQAQIIFDEHNSPVLS